MIFISCGGNDIIKENELEQNAEFVEFYFSFFEQNKGNLIDISSYNLDKKSPLSRLEMNNKILTEINKQLGSELEFSTDFKELELESFESVTNWAYNKGIMTKIDLTLLTDFNKNLNSLGLANAINVLESDVKNSNLNSFKIKKFQYLVNVVKLLENENPGIFVNNTNFQQRGCFGASLGLAFALSTLAGACNPATATATVGTLCYLAAANFVRASIQFGIECGD